MSYDPKCSELAEHFLDEMPHSDKQVAELAQEIQDAIEDWLRDQQTGRVHG